MPDRRPLSRRTLLVVLLATLVLLGGVGTAWKVTHRGLPDGVAARVEGHDITAVDLKERAPSLQALYGVEQPRSGSKLKQFWRDLAKAEVLNRVIAKAAVERAINIPNDQAADSLESYIVTRYGEGEPGRVAFAQALADSGTSERAVLAEVRRQLVVSALYDEITNSVSKPSEAALAEAYDERKCAFKMGPRRQVANIVTATRADASTALSRVEQGEPFAAVARAMSMDTSTSETGGRLGLLEKDQLESAYGDLAFRTPVGHTFGPVKTRYGWNAGLVEAAKPAAVQSFADAKPALTDALIAEQKSKAWRSWIKRELQRAQPEYAEAYRPANPDEPAADPAGVNSSPESKKCYE